MPMKNNVLVMYVVKGKIEKKSSSGNVQEQ